MHLTQLLLSRLVPVWQGVQIKVSSPYEGEMLAFLAFEYLEHLAHLEYLHLSIRTYSL